MQQQVQIYIFLSPPVDSRLGEEGRRVLSRQIRDLVNKRIQGYTPYGIDVVPSFAVQPIAGSSVVGFVSFLLYSGGSAELLKAPIVDAVQTAVAKAVSLPGVAVTVSIGGVFTIYPRVRD